MYCYTTRVVHCYLRLQEKKALKGVSAASLALHAQNFASASEKNAVLKFTNRLSWIRHKICK